MKRGSESEWEYGRCPAATDVDALARSENPAWVERTFGRVAAA
jgi:hypothetical protein